jgi:Zn-dependent M28 family amino/carboxypeptidase
VRTSNGGWRYEIARNPADSIPFLSLKSWVTESSARNILKGAGLDLDRMRESAKSRDFKPVATGLTVKLKLKSDVKTFDSPNVVGKVEGSDAKLNQEFVVLSAHWDHLGIGEPNDKGDRIYNGAYDNASGVAAVLGIAEVLAKTSKSQRPKRSFLFLFPTAEEQGLLGAEYYSQHPVVPLAKTVADINLDGVNFFGKVSDMMALGAERSTMEIALSSAAKERKLTLQADARPEQGFFFRSDHFPFAKVGVPSINLQHGEAFLKPLSAEAEGFFKNYNSKYYHQVTDEYHEWWDMSAMIQETEFALAVGVKIANAVQRPRFNSSDEFAAADQKRFK